jgi:sulfur-carrier protein
MAEKVTVHVPTVLRSHVGDQARLEMGGGTVGEVLAGLMDRHPTLRGRLFDDKGELNRFINVYLNDEDIRFLSNLDSTVKDGDAVMIVPAIAGGRDERDGSLATPRGVETTPRGVR